MLKNILGFILRFILGILTFVGGIFVILFAMSSDFIREKIFRKKPVDNPCLKDLPYQETDENTIKNPVTDNSAKSTF